MRRLGTLALTVLFPLASGCPGTSNGSDAGAFDVPPFDSNGFDVPAVFPDVPMTTGDLPRVGHCGGRRGRYFPASHWIYQDVTSAPVRANSAATTAWLEGEGGWGFGRFQIDDSFVVLDADAATPRVTRSASDPLDYSSPDCEEGVMFPVPAGGRIEGYPDYVCPNRSTGDGDGDCHLLVADFASNTLFESYHTSYEGGQFYSLCMLSWDMGTDLWGAPPTPGVALPSVAARNWGLGRDCTSGDAAGFPIAPLLFTTEEVFAGRIDHAIRFILPNARMQLTPDGSTDGPVYVWPATHAGGPEAIHPDAPIYGSRWRLRADFDPAAAGLDPTNLVVIAVVRALKTYGMLLSDGGNVALTAESDQGCAHTWEELWGDGGSSVLEGIEPSDFQIIDTGGTDEGWDCAPNAGR